MNRLTVWVMIFALGILAAPPSALAQQPSMIPRIGLIRLGSPPDPLADAFVQGLHNLGYVEGQNITVEYRWAQGKPDRIPDLTAELVRLKVDIIVASGTVAGRAAKRATSTIPVVIPAVSDPVAAGLVASLARPGGNITGLSVMVPELSGKRMEVLKEVFPKLSRVSVLRDPRLPPTTDLASTETAARALGLRIQILEVGDISDLEDALTAAKRDRAGALDILSSAFFFAHRTRIVEGVAKARLPAMYEHKDFVTVGGLLAYGPSLPELFRRAATYVDRILKGAKPGDLPVEQPTKFELVVNLKTAKALGLTIPQSILIRADEVIQ